MKTKGHGALGYNVFATLLQILSDQQKYLNIQQKKHKGREFKETDETNLYWKTQYISWYVV